MKTEDCYFCKAEAPYGSFMRTAWRERKHGYAHNSIPVCPKCCVRKLPDLCPCCGERYQHNDLCSIEGICGKCASTIRQSVNNNRARARKFNYQHDITLQEWIETLKAFGFKCAYCLAKRYHLMEHFVPISAGGSTSTRNCVPACQSCNRRKNDKNPNDLGFECSIPLADIERVRQYLTSR